MGQFRAVYAYATHSRRRQHSLWSVHSPHVRRDTKRPRMSNERESIVSKFPINIAADELKIEGPPRRVGRRQTILSYESGAIAIPSQNV